MHRSRPRGSERRRVFSSSYDHDPRSDDDPNKVSGERTRTVSPDPFRHAKALVESFGAKTALQIAQFNAQLAGPNGRYWADVLDSLIGAWERRQETQPVLRTQ